MTAAAPTRRGYIISTGTAVCILIPNENTRSKDYSATRFLARPGHADYTANCKYHGYEDHRGGGHFSGRITAALVAAGAIAQSALEGKGILIGTHIARCAGIADRRFGEGAGAASTTAALNGDIQALSCSDFAVLDPSAASMMRAAIEQAAAEGASVGGVP